MSTPAIEVTPSVPPAIVIRPARGWAALNLKELWRYRELIYFLVWRDVKVRYKQTLLGASWAVLQPVLTMLVFNFLFGTVAKVPTDGVYTRSLHSRRCCRGACSRRRSIAPAAR